MLRLEDAITGTLMGYRVKITRIADGAAVDPDPGQMWFEAEDPRRAQYVYKFGQDDNVVKHAVGDYECQIALDVPGDWQFKARVPTGPGKSALTWIQTAAEDSFA